MDNRNILDDDNGATALDFEVPVGTGLVFEAETAPLANQPEEPVVVVEPVVDEAEPREEEFDIPDELPSEGGDGFIVDPFNRPTYIPRFTEVSDTYRMRDDIRDRIAAGSSRVVVDESAPVDKPDIIPEDEQAAFRHVIINQTSTPAVSDDSITIIKFNSPEVQEASVATEEEIFEEVAAEIEEIILPTVTEIDPEVEEVEPEIEVVEEHADGQPEDDEQSTAIDLEAIRYAEVSPVIYAPTITETEDISPDSVPDESDDSGKRGEYVTIAQRDAIKDKFLDSIMSVKVRLIASLALLLVMLSGEVLSLFGINLMALVGLGEVIGARAVVDAQFAIVLFLLAIPEVVRSFKLLRRGVVSAELILVPSLIVVLMHALTIFITEPNAQYSTFGLLLGIQSVAAILADYHRLSAEFISFKLIARNGVKQILDKRLTRSLEHENIALDGAVDEYKSKIARTFRTTFVSDFFSRTASVIENSGTVIMMATIAFGTALVTSVVAYFLAGPAFYVPSSTFSMVFLLSFPVFSMLSHKLSFHRVGIEAGSENGAFVGERAIYSSADIDVIAYDDVEIFGVEDVTIKNMDAYGSADIPSAMLRMSALFNVVGGPLSRVFSATVAGATAALTDIHIEEDGVCGTLEGHKISAGTRDYMIRHGIAVPGEDRHAASLDCTCAMYAAEDGEANVVFHIRYSFSEEFTMLLPHLKEEHIVPLIYTRDPNITNEFLRVLTLGEDSIRVMKKNTLPPKEEKVYHRVSAGIVTLGSKLNAINMVLISKRYARYHAQGVSSELLAMLFGALLSVIFALTGIFAVPVLILGAVQLAGCAYLYARTIRAFRDKKKDKGN